MSVPLPPESHRYFDEPHFATIASIEPDGRPHLSLVWVGRDGDDVLVSTVVGRRKHQNLVRDPRATVLVYDCADPYHYVEVRGTVTMTEEGGRELIDAHGRKYRGWERYPSDDGTPNVRVVVRLTPEKVVVH
jgi:PPOX class probable F420-dependent enzyme